MNKRDALWLAVIVMIAFLLRVYFSSLRNILESWDSAAYLWLAKSIHQGDGFRIWPDAPAHTWFQPLYPYMISAAYTFTGIYEKAGYYVAALFGSLLIIPAFLLTRLLFSREAAYIAAVTFIFQVRLVEASSLVLTEMPYAFFWLFGLYFGFRIIVFKHRTLGDLIGCGAFMGVASLIRTESNFDFLVIVEIVAFLFLSNLVKKKPRRVSQLYISACCWPPSAFS